MLSNKMIERIKAEGRVDTKAFRYVLSFDYVLEPWPIGYRIKRWTMSDMRRYWQGTIDHETLEARAETILVSDDKTEAQLLWHNT